MSTRPGGRSEASVAITAGVLLLSLPFLILVAWFPLMLLAVVLASAMLLAPPVLAVVAIRRLLAVVPRRELEPRVERVPAYVPRLELEAQPAVARTEAEPARVPTLRREPRARPVLAPLFASVARIGEAARSLGIQLTSRLRAPRRTATVAVVDMVGVCPLGLRIGQQWQLSPSGELLGRLCRPAATAVNQLIGGAEAGSAETAACVCPRGSQTVTFALQAA